MEVAGETENGRARGRHARGEGAGASSPLACLLLARPFFFCAHYFQAPATQARIDGTPRLPEALHARFPVYSDPLVAWGYGRQRSIPRHPRKNLLVYTQGRLMAESPRFYLFFKDPRIFEFDRTKICTPIFCVSVLDYSGLLSTQIILRFYSKV